MDDVQNKVKVSQSVHQDIHKITVWVYFASGNECGYSKHNHFHIDLNPDGCGLGIFTYTSASYVLLSESVSGLAWILTGGKK